jgi:hypothetical protein
MRTDAQLLTDSKVDLEKGIIYDAKHMTVGNARGYDFAIDEGTLQTALQCAQAEGSVRVKIDHGGGLYDVIGYATDFYIESKSLKSKTIEMIDPSDQPTRKILLNAQKWPDKFGLSLHFKYDETTKLTNEGLPTIAITRILSSDFVDIPAANEGLFSEKLTNTNIKKPMTPEEIKELSGAIAEAIKPAIAELGEGYKTGLSELTEKLSALMPKEEEETVAAEGTAEDEKSLSEIVKGLTASLSEVMKERDEKNAITIANTMKSLLGGTPVINTGATPANESAVSPLQVALSEKITGGQSLHTAISTISREQPALLKAAREDGTYFSAVAALSK